MLANQNALSSLGYSDWFTDEHITQAKPIRVNPENTALVTRRGCLLPENILGLSCDNRLGIMRNLQIKPFQGGK